MRLLAGWVARCQALNVEGVTCVRSTISYMVVFPRLPHAQVETLQRGGGGVGVKTEALRSPAEVLCSLSGGLGGYAAVWHWVSSLCRVPGVLDPGIGGCECQKTGKEIQFADIPTTLTKWIQLHDGSIKCY